jgi:hypothetical protein
VAEPEKDSAWVKDVAGAYREQIIERLKALVVESESWYRKFEQAAKWRICYL